MKKAIFIALMAIATANIQCSNDEMFKKINKAQPLSTVYADLLVIAQAHKNIARELQQYVKKNDDKEIKQDLSKEELKEVLKDRFVSHLVASTDAQINGDHIKAMVHLNCAKIFLNMSAEC